MPRQGFLGTGAPLSADVTLAIEVAMGLTLVLGMLLARRQRYRAHAGCQSAVVALNLIVIAQLMVPSFRSQVAPKIPARLARTYYTVATGHAMMGCIAELLGLYIILAAGTKILPEGLRFVRYRLWMRIALVIWWIALLLGLTTYARWYLVPKQFLVNRVAAVVCDYFRHWKLSRPVECNASGPVSAVSSNAEPVGQVRLN